MKLIHVVLILAVVNAFMLVNAKTTFVEDDVTYTENIRPIFQKYCVSCHEGSMNYEGAVASKDKILKKLVNLKQMPPKYISDRPTDAEIELIKKWILTGTKK